MAEQLIHEEYAGNPNFAGSLGTAPGMRHLIPNLYLESGRINGNAVRTYRLMHRMTQKQLAAFLDCSVSTVRNIELGDKQPGDGIAELLYMLALATREIMEDHGIVPPHLSFKKYVDGSVEHDSLPRVGPGRLADRLEDANKELSVLREQNRALRQAIDVSLAAIIEQATTAQKQVRQGVA